MIDQSPSPLNYYGETSEVIAGSSQKADEINYWDRTTVRHLKSLSLVNLPR